MEPLFHELIEGQKQKLYLIAKRIISSITPEDLLQPNDFPLLDNHPEFRYEEGVLHGFLAAQIAIKNSMKTKIDLT